MSTFSLTDADVNIAGDNLSAFVKSVSLTLEKTAHDDTNMGDATHINLAGLRTWSVSVTFSQDFAGSAIADKLWDIYDGTGRAVIIIKPTSSAVSASNPSYTGTGILTSMPILDSSVGEQAEVSVTFVSAGAQARGV